MAHYDRSKMTSEVMALQRKFAARPGVHLTFTNPDDRQDTFMDSPVKPFMGMSFAAFVQTGVGNNGQEVTIALFGGGGNTTGGKTRAIEMHQGTRNCYLSVKHDDASNWAEKSGAKIDYTAEMDGRYVWFELKLLKPQQTIFYINDKYVTEHGDVNDGYVTILRELPKVRYHQASKHTGKVYELHWTRIDGGVDGIFPTDATLLKNMFFEAPVLCMFSTGGKIKLKGKYAKKNDNSPNGIEIFVVDIEPESKKSEGYAKHTLKDRTPDKVQTILVTMGGTGAQVFSENESAQMTSEGVVSGMRQSVLKFDNFDPISVTIERGMKKFGKPWGV
ncbi:hypothetical protein ISCGN_027167 [Ixodes scapularis]